MKFKFHGVQLRLAITCGAKNRQGMPCGQKAVYLNGRCRFHGGLSTGPTTVEGKRRSIAAMRAGYKAWLDRTREAKELGVGHLNE
jgi:hypothetical protein